ncbi:hypothetical protein H0H87_005132, partial [Tephrocybe sp. NHM501043]
FGPAILLNHTWDTVDITCCTHKPTNHLCNFSALLKIVCDECSLYKGKIPDGINSNIDVQVPIMYFLNNTISLYQIILNLASEPIVVYVYKFIIANPPDCPKGIDLTWDNIDFNNV